MKRGTLCIEHMQVQSILGVYPEERVKEQIFYLDLIMDVDVSKCVESDSLEDTIDYDVVAAFCRSVAVEGKFQLIETFVSTLITALMNCFALLAVKVKVKKVGALPTAKWATFEMSSEDNL